MAEKKQRPGSYGNNRNPKGNPSTLVPGPKPGIKAGPDPWGGPTDEEWQTLLGKISEGGKAAYIVRSEWDVCYDTFCRWRKRNPDKDKEFFEALEARSETWLDEILEIADDCENDVSEGPKGGLSINVDVVSRAKLRVETRKWAMQMLHARFKPKQDVTFDLSQASTEVILEALKKSL